MTLEVVVSADAADIVASTGTVSGYFGDYIADDGFLYPLNQKTDTSYLSAGLTSITQQVRETGGDWADSALALATMKSTLICAMSKLPVSGR